MAIPYLPLKMRIFWDDDVLLVDSVPVESFRTSYDPQNQIIHHGSEILAIAGKTRKEAFVTCLGVNNCEAGQILLDGLQELQMADEVQLEFTNNSGIHFMIEGVKLIGYEMDLNLFGEADLKMKFFYNSPSGTS